MLLEMYYNNAQCMILGIIACTLSNSNRYKNRPVNENSYASVNTTGQSTM